MKGWHGWLQELPLRGGVAPRITRQRGWLQELPVRGEGWGWAPPRVGAATRSLDIGKERDVLGGLGVPKILRFPRRKIRAFMAEILKILSIIEKSAILKSKNKKIVGSGDCTLSHLSGLPNERGKMPRRVRGSIPSPGTSALLVSPLSGMRKEWISTVVDCDVYYG